MKLTCQSCGKKYDSDQDELCPHCGAYNPFHSDDRGETLRRLDREEKASHREHRAYQEECPCEDTWKRREEQEGRKRQQPPTAQPKPFSYQADDPDRNRPVQNNIPFFLILIIGVFVIFVGSKALPDFLGRSADRYQSDENITFLTVGEGQEFNVGDLSFTVRGMGDLDINQAKGIWGITVPEGQRLLYVDAAVQNQSGKWEPDPKSIYLLMDGKLYRDYLSEVDLFDVYGPLGLIPMMKGRGFDPGETEVQFLFSVPAGVKEFTFCIGETEEHFLYGERISKVHQVPLFKLLELERGGESA